MALVRGMVLLALTCCAACAAGRPERPRAALEGLPGTLPAIRLMSMFPGYVSGFAAASSVQQWHGDEVCLSIERASLPAETPAGAGMSELPISVVVGGARIPAAAIRVEAVGQYRRYCFALDVTAGLHLMYVELTTRYGIEAYSWEFSVELQ